MNDAKTIVKNMCDLSTPAEHSIKFSCLHPLPQSTAAGTYPAQSPAPEGTDHLEAPIPQLPACPTCQGHPTKNAAHTYVDKNESYPNSLEGLQGVLQLQSLQGRYVLF